MSTFSSANITYGNLVLKERTHRIKIKYSMHQYSIRLHNLGNWLIIKSTTDNKQPNISKNYKVHTLTMQQKRIQQVNSYINDHIEKVCSANFTLRQIMASVP